MFIFLANSNFIVTFKVKRVGSMTDALLISDPFRSSRLDLTAASGHLSEIKMEF